MIKIGITGGIGSGKTTVCKIFETLGIPVYYADSRAKRLMTSNKPLKKAIIALLGKEAYFKNGRLNRKYIGNCVFNDKELLKKLNALVHPVVHQDSKAWFDIQKTPYALKEAALLFESNGHLFLDKVITVLADQDERIRRVIERDGSSKKDVIARMNNQWKDSQRIEKSDFIIENNRKELLIPQIMQIHKELLKLSR